MFHRIFSPVASTNGSCMLLKAAPKMLIQSSPMDGVVGKRGDQSLEKISETIVPSYAKLYRMELLI